MSKLWAERLVALTMIVVAGYFYTQSTGWPGTAGAFPQFTEFAVIILAVIMIVRSLITHDKKFSGNVRFDFSYMAMKPVVVMVVAVIYGYAIFEIGFYVSSIIVYFVVTWLTGIRNHKVMVLVALGLFPLMYLFFTIGLDADLPRGFLI